MLKQQTKPEKEISFLEVIDKTREIASYVLKRWMIILVVGCIGGAVGLTYALLKPVRYVSRLSFVLEDNKASGGGLAALAGQFGFDIGGSGGGIFSGDNILLFLKSESLCREALLTKYDLAGKQLLADKYAEVSELKRKWSKDNEIGQVNFAQYKDGVFPRLQDSLMQLIVKEILTKDLSVSKPDKKASFIEVSVATRDELLSKYFSERLVAIAIDRYVESKTRVKAINVARLQHRADSLGALLNNRTYSAAAAQQNLVDLNPALRTVSTPAEIISRDKTMTATIFAEVVKNLEISKVALSQETPAIQMVDQSSLPLKKDKAKKLTSIVVGGILFSFLSIFIILARRWWKIQVGQQAKKTAEA